MYYSQSTGGFYSEEIHGFNMPADVVEVTAEEYIELLVSQSNGQTIKPDSKGRPVLADLPVLTVTVEALCRSVDMTADTVRSKLIGDPWRFLEYEQTAREAESFAANGCRGAVPPMVAAWVVNGRTAQQATDDILHEAARCKVILAQLRAIRLNAKELIRSAISAGDNEMAKIIAADTVAAINAM